MSAISASYQPNKIKRKGYTSWIDESNQFCTTMSGTTLDNVGGQNLMDAFDVDWSAYEINGQPASAKSIIDKLNTPATVTNNFLGVLENQNQLLGSQDRSTKEGSYWIVGADIDIIIGEKTYKSLHAGDQVIINVGAHDYDIEDASGFEECYYCVQINMSGYLPLTGGTMQGNINFKNEFNTIYGDDNNLHLNAHTAINFDAQETNIHNIFPQTNTSNIGSSSNAFNNVYANHFVKAGYDDKYVLLAGGGTKALSDLPGYLRLTGGTMSGDILPDNHAPAIGRDFAMEPGVTPPTYRSLGSENSYFNKIYAREFKGLANNALQLYTYKDGNLTYIAPIAVNKGNEATPVYFKDGVPVACNSIPTSDTVASWGYVMSSGITKLNVGDGLQGKANNGDPVDAITTSVGTITLKTASENKIGGIKLGYLTNGKNYPVNVNTAGQAYVNVPWTDTTYSLDGYLTSTEAANTYVKKTGDTMTGALSATAFYETSDIRKKEIKSDLSLDKCYDLIDKCQTVIYSLKDQTKEQVGMIAQEIEEFFPEVVATDEEGFKSLAYDRLVVICFKVLKDVIKRLEKLES